MIKQFDDLPSGRDWAISSAAPLLHAASRVTIGPMGGSEVQRKGEGSLTPDRLDPIAVEAL